MHMSTRPTCMTILTAQGNVYQLALSLFQTFPEIVPYINVCVNLMEQIYSVKVDSREDGPSSEAAAQVGGVG